MKPEIIILTGPVHTGKSTALGEWVNQQKASGLLVCGLLNPAMDGKKVFVNIHRPDEWSMESEGMEAVISVGKYRFSAAAFERARHAIIEAGKTPCDALVMDEIGKLELQGHGLEPAITTCLGSLDRASCKRLVLVIRDYLLEDAIKHYGLNDARVVTKETLPKL